MWWWVSGGRSRRGGKAHWPPLGRLGKGPGIVGRDPGVAKDAVTSTSVATLKNEGAREGGVCAGMRRTFDWVAELQSIELDLDSLCDGLVLTWMLMNKTEMGLFSCIRSTMTGVLLTVSVSVAEQSAVFGNVLW